MEKRLHRRSSVETIPDHLSESRDHNRIKHHVIRRSKIFTSNFDKLASNRKTRSSSFVITEFQLSLSLSLISDLRVLSPIIYPSFSPYLSLSLFSLSLSFSLFLSLSLSFSNQLPQSDTPEELERFSDLFQQDDMITKIKDAQDNVFYMQCNCQGKY